MNKNNKLKRVSKKQLELTYEVNYSLPFKYEYEIENKCLVELVKEYTSDDNNEIIDGAPVTNHYIFKGLKEGKTTITFKTISIDDNKIIIEEKNYITIDKNKTITLIKQDK